HGRACPRTRYWPGVRPRSTRATRNSSKRVNVYVFTGPTISAAEARQELDAVYLPPAAEGDVFRLVLRRPEVIGSIDGYLHSVPTVRHKEILWAMSQGIHVFGSASIGALRAVELA